MSDHESRVVIIGANFAGLAAAKRLQGKAHVTLIDPSPNFEFTPNIHEIISNEKMPSEVQLDRETVITALGHTWIQDKVVSINREQKSVELAGGETVAYDACIVTVGGINNYAGVKGAEKNAIPFKTVENCTRIEERISQLNLKGEAYTVVIAGGGSVGVEALGELLRYRTEGTPINIELVEAKDRLLPGFSPKVNKEVLKLCKDQHVNFHFGNPIAQVNAKSVKLADGQTISTDLCIWTAGVKPSPLLFEAGLSDEENTWAPVYKSLQSTKDKYIFIAGDAAAMGKLDSKQAYFAMETGEKAAENVLRMLKDRPLRNFFKIQKPYVYSFGDLSCFLIFHDLVIAGAPIALLKESIFRITIEGIRAGHSVESMLKLIDQLFPKYIANAATNVKAFLANPVKYVLNPPVEVL
ncbi:MAG: FAD-dependent oxidoreductase [Bacteroidota bacterium]